MPTIVPHLTYRRYPAFVLSWVWHVLVILVWLKLLTQVYSSTVLPNVVPPTPSPRIANRELLVHPVTPNNIATNEGIRVCSAQKYILYNLYNVRYFPQIPTMDLGGNQLNHLTWMCIQVTKCFFPIHITIYHLWNHLTGIFHGWLLPPTEIPCSGFASVPQLGFIQARNGRSDPREHHQTLFLGIKMALSQKSTAAFEKIKPWLLPYFRTNSSESLGQKGRGFRCAVESQCHIETALVWHLRWRA